MYENTTPAFIIYAHLKCTCICTYMAHDEATRTTPQNGLKLNYKPKDESGGIIVSSTFSLNPCMQRQLTFRTSGNVQICTSTSTSTSTSNLKPNLKYQPRTATSTSSIPNPQSSILKGSSSNTSLNRGRRQGVPVIFLDQ